MYSLNPTFQSRRSDVLGCNGMAASSQPLAVQAGIEILRQGGNAASAAIAVAAVLSVVEPTSTGIGGDCFALHFDAGTNRVTALNGSGRAPDGASIQELRNLGYSRMPQFTGHSVSVPGTVAGWHDLLERHGNMSLAEVLPQAIRYAEEGFPVSEWIARSWHSQAPKLRRDPDWDTPDLDVGPPQQSGHELLINGRAPRAGEVMTMPEMGSTLRGIAESGPSYIYRGEFAERLAKHVQTYGGWITPKDMAGHTSTWEESLKRSYRGYTLHECPPNGQGLAALMAIGLAEGFDLARMSEGDRVHVMVESMRLAFADAQRYVFDPKAIDLETDFLLTDDYLAHRRGTISMSQAADDVPFGMPLASSDTVYLSVIDGEGNACSFINSLYMGTGSGLVVPGTGISLQNRAALFEVQDDHPNALAPGKRPYHTIIPALVTQGHNLVASLGVMGGFMQPQGHFQMMANLYDHGMSPQRALDAPRWQLGGPVMGVSNSLGTCSEGGQLSLEKGFEPETYELLARRGHKVSAKEGYARGGFGGGQIICRHPESGVLTAGSDPRKDGCAAGW